MSCCVIGADGFYCEKTVYKGGNGYMEFLLPVDFNLIGK